MNKFNTKRVGPLSVNHAKLAKMKRVSIDMRWAAEHDDLVLHLPISPRGQYPSV